MSEVKKCPKCGSTSFREKSVKIHGSLGMLNILEAKACICNNCGYIELYEEKKEEEKS
jgi:predicted nucleic-acid-binding Zn-ribbon protein